MATTSRRLEALLSALQWGGIADWGMVKPALRGQAIPEMKRWVRQHLYLIPDTYADEKRYFVDYYLNGKSARAGDYMYKAKKAGEMALAALYRYQQEESSGRSDG